jgi:putative ABC transport system ATP-binding protein
MESFADRVIHIEDGRILDDRRVTSQSAPAAADRPLIGA